MANLIKIDTLEYPVSETEFKNRFPNIAFPQGFNDYQDYGYAVVFPSPQPIYTYNQTIREKQQPVLINDKYYQDWEVVNIADSMTTEEYEAWETNYKKSLVPMQVTMRQARLVLLQAGLLDDVELAINNIADETIKRAIQIEWEYAQDIKRDWQALIMVTQQMGMTDEQLDNLFIEASKL